MTNPTPPVSMLMHGSAGAGAVIPDDGWMTTTHLSFGRTGTGEPLLLLHGFGSTSADFTALIPELSAHFEVLTVDLPGHGDSPMIADRPSVAAITAAIENDLDTLGLPRVHILGNSLGGRIAIELARRGRALSVVSISPSGLGLPAERVHQGLLMVTSRLINQMRRPWLTDLSASPAGRALLLAGMRALPWRASREEALTMKGGFAEQRGFWPTLWNAIMIDVPTGLRDIDCPVVVAQGAMDVVGSGQTPRYTPLIPTARFVLLPVAGHAPHSDAPHTIVGMVRRTAAETAAAA